MTGKTAIIIVVGVLMLGGINRLIVGPPPDQEHQNIKNYDSSKVNKQKTRKGVRKTLKGGYFACISDELFDEIIGAAVRKDNLAIDYLLSNGCVLTTSGIRFSVIDLGIGTTKIRVYSSDNSVIVYTNTENIYY